MAQPDIQGELAASRDEGTWILTTYTTCWLIGLVLSNWLAARIGYRRHMMAAVVMFMFAAIGCGLSHTLTQMLIFRGFMGFAGGSFLVRGQTAINLAFLGKDRFKALLVFGFAVVCIARLCAAAVGGYLTEWHSWRAVFVLNVPLSLAVLALLAALREFKAVAPAISSVSTPAAAITLQDHRRSGRFLMEAAEKRTSIAPRPEWPGRSQNMRRRCWHRFEMWKTC